jgi:hypothetical protein
VQPSGVCNSGGGLNAAVEAGHDDFLNEGLRFVICCLDKYESKYLEAWLTACAEKRKKRWKSEVLVYLQAAVFAAWVSVFQCNISVQYGVTQSSAINSGLSSLAVL